MMSKLRSCIFLIIFMSINLSAQITNFTVNGASSNFSVIQGELFQWEYNLPIGGTAICEIWVDLNNNGQIDPEVDKSVFGRFAQTDGDLRGNQGPIDMDSLVNGHCLIKMTEFGLAPARYVFRFTNASISSTINGTVLPLSSPAFTMSGKVTPPAGISAQNILVSAEVHDGGMNQWLALTDAEGNYRINFNSNCSGLLYRVRLMENFSPYLPIPTDTIVTLNGNLVNINFSFGPPAAKIVGYLKGDDGHIFQNVEIYSWPNNDGNERRVKTDANGFYEIGYSANDLQNNQSWGLEVSEEIGPAYLSPSRYNIQINLNDSLRKDLTAYVANDSITGYVRINGRAPGNQVYSVQLIVEDSGKAWTLSEPNSGYFSAKVSRKLFNYYPWIESLPNDQTFEWPGPIHPGATGNMFNITTVAWTRQNGPTNNSLFTLAAINSSAAFAAGAYGTLIYTTNGGAAWQQANSGTTTNINSICFVSPHLGWFCGGNGMIKKTTDGGLNWSEQTSGINSDLFVIQFIDASTGWAAGGNFGPVMLLKTTNGGQTWQQQTVGLNGAVTHLSVIDQNTLWLLCAGSLSKSTNGGTSWSFVNSPGGLNAICFTTGTFGWAVGNGNQVYVTSDGGSNWSQQSLYGGVLRDVFGISTTTAWVVGDYNTIFRSTNGGSTWVKQPCSNQNTQILNAVRFCDARNGWSVGGSGMILHTATGGVFSAISSELHAGVNRFELFQNYPNPFNPTTTITFNLPGSDKTVLTIFDMLGRQVAKLLDKDMEAGTHSITWNAANLSSGVYFYYLQAGQRSITRKLLLIK